MGSSLRMKEMRIMHLDMDAFFASIEQRDNPQLRGKPVIVGGTVESRGVVSTCSYEARLYGVHSGMPISQALRKCPDGIFLGLDGHRYMHASKKLMAILFRFSPKVETVSIDEAFVDVTGSRRLYPSERELAQAVKRAIVRELGVTATVGIAPNKIMAKIASGLNKPDGLTLIQADEIAQKLYPLPVTAMWGVGKRTAEALSHLHIQTLGDLARAPEERLKKVFGRNGPVLVRLARGESDSPVLAPSEIPAEKSVGHEHTFGEDIDQKEILLGELLLLSQKVARRLRRKQFQGKRVTLKCRFENFETHTHQMTFAAFTDSEDRIYQAACQLFQERMLPGRKIRLLGISVSQLTRDVQLDSFSAFDFLTGRARKEARLFPVIDELKDRFGEGIIWRGSTLPVLQNRF